MSHSLSSYFTTIFSSLTYAPWLSSFFWEKGSILALTMISSRCLMVISSSESKMKQSSGVRFLAMRNLALA